MTLIEVIVACSLLAITFTSLTALNVKLAARNRSNASVEQRTATSSSRSTAWSRCRTTR